MTIYHAILIVVLLFRGNNNSPLILVISILFYRLQKHARRSCGWRGFRLFGWRYSFRRTIVIIPYHILFARTMASTQYHRFTRSFFWFSIIVDTVNAHNQTRPNAILRHWSNHRSLSWVIPHLYVSFTQPLYIILNTYDLSDPSMKYVSVRSFFLFVLHICAKGKTVEAEPKKSASENDLENMLTCAILSPFPSSLYELCLNFPFFFFWCYSQVLQPPFPDCSSYSCRSDLLGYYIWTCDVTMWP